jgi:hypothetical protein
MYSVLLVVDLSAGESLESRSIREYFLGDIAKVLLRYPEIETLGENCWLIPLSGGLQRLAAVVSAAEGRHLRHRALFFQEPPIWVSSLPTS